MQVRVEIQTYARKDKVGQKSYTCDSVRASFKVLFLRYVSSKKLNIHILRKNLSFFGIKRLSIMRLDFYYI